MNFYFDDFTSDSLWLLRTQPHFGTVTSGPAKLIVFVSKQQALSPDYDSDRSSIFAKDAELDEDHFGGKEPLWAPLRNLYFRQN